MCRRSGRGRPPVASTSLPGGVPAGGIGEQQLVGGQVLPRIDAEARRSQPLDERAEVETDDRVRIGRHLPFVEKGLELFSQRLPVAVLAPSAPMPASAMLAGISQPLDPCAHRSRA